MYYLVNPVLREIEKKVIALYEAKELSQKQTILILNTIKDGMEQYNLKHSGQSVQRCGKCLKILKNNTAAYSLEEEINKITGGGWWSEELDNEAAFDVLCQECRDLIIQKYFSKDNR